LAKTKRRKGKRRLRKAIGRWAWRQVSNWAQTQRARLRKTFAPKVVHPSAKLRAWELQFPDPRRHPERVMERVDEWLAEFTAVLDNSWEVPFQVDVHDRQPLAEAAYEAAERIHGPVARTRSIVDIRPENDLAAELLEEK
jgi:hypothetical protein